MHKEKLLQREGGHVVLIGGSRGMGLVTVCRARDAGAEVTIAGRSPDKLLQAQQELGQVHTIVMDITDEGAVEKGFAGLSHVDHELVSAGTIRHSPMDTMTSLRHVR
jgi:NADP-dependent 3-hydroxy acid dehydrogenase YdfG